MTHRAVGPDQDHVINLIAECRSHQFELVGSIRADNKPGRFCHCRGYEQTEGGQQVKEEGLSFALFVALELGGKLDRKSTRLNSSHLGISYAVFCLKKKY